MTPNSATASAAASETDQRESKELLGGWLLWGGDIRSLRITKPSMPQRRP
jgi:hypothetical protein